jgi:cation diffusion facilitator CzcD-associated flavoprotein CzcO
MLKTLREDGFVVTLFERRGKVGGLWSYTDDTSMTTAMPCMVNSSQRIYNSVTNASRRDRGKHKQIYLRLHRLPHAGQYVVA